MAHTASALETVNAVNGQPDWEAIGRLISTWRPEALIVGIPLNMDGSSQGMTNAARRFANQLREHFHLPVHTADERLSSQEAKQQLAATGTGKRDMTVHKDLVNQVAARVILQAWLNDHHSVKPDDTASHHQKNSH